jgi:hypothetical protein
VRFGRLTTFGFRRLPQLKTQPVYTTEFAPRIVRVERRTSGGLPVFYLIPILGCGGTDYDALTPHVSAVWQNAYFAEAPGGPTPERGLTFNASTDAVLGASDGLYFLYYEDEVSVLEPGRQIKARFVLANRLTIKKLTDFRNAGADARSHLPDCEGGQVSAGRGRQSRGNVAA